MTEKNTEIMRDAFRLLAAHESPPDEMDELWWKALVKDASNMSAKWKDNRLAFHLADAIVNALSDEFARRNRVEQIQMVI